MSWQQKADALAESLSNPGAPPNAHVTVREDIRTLIGLVEDDPDAAEALEKRLRAMQDLTHGDLVQTALDGALGAQLDRIIEPGLMDRYPILN